MNDDEMKVCFRRWIEKFIDEEGEKKRLLDVLELEDVPVKGVLAALTPHFNSQFSLEDKDMLQKLVYYYI